MARRSGVAKALPFWVGRKAYLCFSALRDVADLPVSASELASAEIRPAQDSTDGTLELLTTVR